MSSCLGFFRFIVCMDLDDVGKTCTGQVMTGRHHLDARSELLEVEPFRERSGLRPEERNDMVKQILSRVHGVEMHVLPVVVTPPVDVHLPYSEELTEPVEA